jgi:hypothetical protein
MTMTMTAATRRRRRSRPASEFKFEPNAWTVPRGRSSPSSSRTTGPSITVGGAQARRRHRGRSRLRRGEGAVRGEAVPAGESATQKFTVDEAGTYQVICAIETHFNAGMEGALTVE